MAEVVNLHREKKRRARAAEADVARENRVRHGRTGAQKAADRLAAERQERVAEGLLIEEEKDWRAE